MPGNFSVVNVYGHPENDNMCFDHLLKKNKLWIGARDAVMKKVVKSIMESTTYFIIYKTRKQYGVDGGWFDVYKKTNSVHEVHSMVEWNKLTNMGKELPQPSKSHDATQDAIKYYEDGGVDYLINVDKVYNGRIKSPEQLPNQRRIQRITNPSNINYLKEIIA